MMSKVNPKIDLVFKKLFGSEENKDILLSLINAILPHHSSRSGSCPHEPQSLFALTRYISSICCL